MEKEDPLAERLRQAMPAKNLVLAKNMAKLFDEYERDGYAARNEWDAMNLDQVLGPDLSYLENKSRVLKHLKDSGYYSPKEMELEEARKARLERKLLDVSAQQDISEKLMAESEETKDKYQKALAELATKRDVPLNELLCSQIPSIRAFHQFLELLLDKSKYNTACFIVGPAGTRKSYHIMAELQSRGLPFVMYNSHASPLGLYELLYKNHNSVVVLDDIESILDDKRSIGILKAASFSAVGERVVTWASTAKVLKERDLPERFIFSGKIIIVANDMNGTKKETFRAFLNRMYTHQIVMTAAEKKLLVRTVFDRQEASGMTDMQKNEILDFMESILDFSNLDQYNLRTAFKAAEIWQNIGKDRAKELICNLLETDENMRKFLMIEDAGRNLGVEQKVEVWKRYTGLCRSGYYSIKSRYYKSEHSRELIREKEMADIDEIIRHLN